MGYWNRNRFRFLAAKGPLYGLPPVAPWSFCSERAAVAGVDEPKGCRAASRERNSTMTQFLASTQAGCRRSFPRHLLHRITTLTITVVAALISQLIYTPTTYAKSSDKPNIVIIMADDLGYGDVKCFGGDRSRIDTPAFDRLAAEGMRFRAPWGFIGPVLPDGQFTIGTMLQSAGYRTGYIGKWHLGTLDMFPDAFVRNNRWIGKVTRYVLQRIPPSAARPGSRRSRRSAGFRKPAKRKRRRPSYNCSIWKMTLARKSIWPQSVRTKYER